MPRATQVAALGAANTGVPATDGTPYAELWLGTHPSGAAKLSGATARPPAGVCFLERIPVLDSLGTVFTCRRDTVEVLAGVEAGGAARRCCCSPLWRRPSFSAQNLVGGQGAEHPGAPGHPAGTEAARGAPGCVQGAACGPQGRECMGNAEMPQTDSSSFGRARIA